jgi:hypothetical protein
MEPADQDYGSRDYIARDIEGNLWSFGTYDPSADPSTELSTEPAADASAS